MSLRVFAGALIVPVLCLPPATTAGTIRVPGDQPTIQAGLAAASAGDVVLIAPGTWLERNLVLVSDVTVAGETGDPADVVIDAQGLGRVATAVGLGAATELRGITLRNGFSTSHGAGVYTSNTDLRLIDCRFESNQSGNWGGGAAFQGSCSPVIERCAFSGNTALYGGGIYCETGSPVVTDCLFENNFATHAGGGMQAWYPASSPTLTGCTFAGNESLQYSGGAFSVQYGSALLAGCTVYDNRAGATGAGVHAHQGAQLVLDHCLIAFQRGAAEPAACQGGATITVSCSDVYGNAAGDWVGCLAGLLGSGGNLEADPGFCGAESGDFTLHSGSPAAPGATPCGQIGAWGVGCGAAPTTVAAGVRPASWGAVKAGFRD